MEGHVLVRANVLKSQIEVCVCVWVCNWCIRLSLYVCLSVFVSVALAISSTMFVYLNTRGRKPPEYITF